MSKEIKDLNQIKKNLRSHPFALPKLMQSVHAQTMLQGFYPHFKTKLPKNERRLIKLSDGSQLAADCWWQENKKKHATIVILSGLEGYLFKKRSHFVKQLSYKAHHFGFNVIHLMQRAEGDTITLTKSLLSAYPVDDIATALEEFNSWGLQKFYFAGLSGGGWVVLYTIARLDKELKECILGVVSIDAPMNFFVAWNHVRSQIFYKCFLLHLYKN